MSVSPVEDAAKAAAAREWPEGADPEFVALYIRAFLEGVKHRQQPLKQLINHSAISTREILQDAGFKGHGNMLGWNPSWVKVADLNALSAPEIPDCTCRTASCGHRASQHVGPNGACVICLKECWF